MNVFAHCIQLAFEHVKRCLVQACLLAVLLGHFVLFLEVWCFLQVGDVACVEDTVHVLQHLVVYDLRVDQEECGRQSLRAGLHQAFLHVFLPVFIDSVVFCDFNLEQLKSEYIVGKFAA